MTLPIHPVVVHFPIALLMAGVLLELIGWIGRRESAKQAAVWVLVLGALGGLAAIGSGLMAKAEALEEGAPRMPINTHHLYGSVAVTLFVLLALVRLALKRRMGVGVLVVYLLAAIAGVALVAYTGYTGGRLVYEQHVGH